MSVAVNIDPAHKNLRARRGILITCQTCFKKLDITAEVLKNKKQTGFWARG